jgi:hypothetical protein
MAMTWKEKVQKQQIASCNLGQFDAMTLWQVNKDVLTRAVPAAALPGLPSTPTAPDQ